MNGSVHWRPAAVAPPTAAGCTCLYL